MEGRSQSQSSREGSRCTSLLIQRQQSGVKCLRTAELPRVEATDSTLRAASVYGHSIEKAKVAYVLDHHRNRARLFCGPVIPSSSLSATALTTTVQGL